MAVTVGSPPKVRVHPEKSALTDPIGLSQDTVKNGKEKHSSANRNPAGLITFRRVVRLNIAPG
ncbi:hypothetical protein GCM10010470_13670 [Saccharopolyspora taberi]|uniref:Uncharacterized protein n=1 Tax=Saccharopolyspora taberi TaxID=60895 RepID=A0ABN3V7P3_9PSEU